MPYHPSQEITSIPYYICNGQTHSASASLKWLINGKAPHCELDTFTHIDGSLYKHAMDASQKFLALVIPKSRHFTVLVKACDNLGHQDLLPY